MPAFSYKILKELKKCITYWNNNKTWSNIKNTIQTREHFHRIRCENLVEALVNWKTYPQAFHTFLITHSLEIKYPRNVEAIKRAPKGPIHHTVIGAGVQLLLDCADIQTKNAGTAAQKGQYFSKRPPPTVFSISRRRGRWNL